MLIHSVTTAWASSLLCSNFGRAFTFAAPIYSGSFPSVWNSLFWCSFPFTGYIIFSKYFFYYKRSFLLNVFHSDLLKFDKPGSGRVLAAVGAHKMGKTIHLQALLEKERQSNYLMVPCRGISTDQHFVSATLRSLGISIWFCI